MILENPSTLFRDQVDQRGIAECLAGLAGALASMPHPTRAARLFGAAERLFDAAGADIYPANAADYARSLEVVRSNLSEQAFAGAWSAARGLAMAPEAT